MYGSALVGPKHASVLKCLDPTYSHQPLSTKLNAKLASNASIHILSPALDLTLLCPQNSQRDSTVGWW